MNRLQGVAIELRSRVKFIRRVGLADRVAKVLTDHRWVEPVAFIGLLMLFIWWAQPALPGLPRVFSVFALLALPLASHLFHHEHAADVGIRVDNLRKSSREVAIATAGASLVLLGIGAVFGWRPNLDARLAFMPIGYLVWGFSQQYALQSFVHRRLGQSRISPVLVPLVSALLFAAVHLPNPVLVPTTFVMGYIWCLLYRRTPNLFTLAVSHAWLATLIMALIPVDVHHNMRVGPGWFRW